MPQHLCVASLGPRTSAFAKWRHQTLPTRIGDEAGPLSAAAPRSVTAPPLLTGECSMKRISQVFALAALAAAGMAAAQTPPPSSPSPSSPSSTPSAPYPGSTAPSSSSSTSQTPSSDTSSGSSKATESQMKACMSAQLSNNSAMSKADAKKYCKSQLGGSPNG